MNLVITVDNLVKDGKKIMVSTRADYETRKEVYSVEDYTGLILDKAKYNSRFYLSYSAVLALEKELEFVVNKFREKEDYITKLTINASQKLEHALLVRAFENKKALKGFDVTKTFGQAFQEFLDREGKTINNWRNYDEIKLVVGSLVQCQRYICVLLGLDNKGNEIEGADAIEVELIVSDVDPVLNDIRYNLTYKGYMVNNSTRSKKYTSQRESINKVKTGNRVPTKENRISNVGVDTLDGKNKNKAMERIAKNRERLARIKAGKEKRMQEFLDD